MFRTKIIAKIIDNQQIRLVFKRKIAFQATKIVHFSTKQQNFKELTFSVIRIYGFVFYSICSQSRYPLQFLVAFSLFQYRKMSLLARAFLRCEKGVTLSAGFSLLSRLELRTIRLFHL